MSPRFQQVMLRDRGRSSFSPHQLIILHISFIAYHHWTKPNIEMCECQTQLFAADCCLSHKNWRISLLMFYIFLNCHQIPWKKTKTNDELILLTVIFFVDKPDITYVSVLNRVGAEGYRQAGEDGKCWETVGFIYIHRYNSRHCQQKCISISLLMLTNMDSFLQLPLIIVIVF